MMITGNNNSAPRSMMIVFAHPDDESLAMGGAIARYASEGVEIHLICATRGEWGSISETEAVEQDDLAAVREMELRAAAALLGIKSLEMYDAPDGNLMYTYWPETEERIVHSIRRLRPQVIVTFGPDGMYGHPDHIAVSMLVTASFKSAADPACFPQHLDEGLTPHQASKLYYTQLPRTQIENFITTVQTRHKEAHLWDLDLDNFIVTDSAVTTEIDIRDFIDQKLRAIRCHRTQFDPRNVFSLASRFDAQAHIDREFFKLVHPAVETSTIERDLFEGVVG